MTIMHFTSEPTVELIRVDGEEIDIAHSAWVSTKGERSEDEDDATRVAGLINFLMKNRHGSPFEQCDMRFRIKAPIFVWREIMRHRVASYNEESGRYRQLDPEFYIPGVDRPLRQEGKAGAYNMVPGTVDETDFVRLELQKQCESAYHSYVRMLESGIAREVARQALPLNIMSTAYVKMNLRGLMNFLSLRINNPEAAFPSTPLYEIEQVALRMDHHFRQHFPYTYHAWVRNGRVCP